MELALTKLQWTPAVPDSKDVGGPVATASATVTICLGLTRLEPGNEKKANSNKRYADFVDSPSTRI